MKEKAASPEPARRLIDQPIYTLEEVAAWLRIDPRDALLECRRGRLRLRRIGHEYRCLQSDLEKFLEIRCLPRAKGPTSASMPTAGSTCIGAMDTGDPSIEVPARRILASLGRS